MADPGFTNQESGNGEYITRRELNLTLRPLIDVQTQQTSILTEISGDIKRLVLQREREEGAKAAAAKVTDRRRFWLTMVATLCSGIIVVAVIAIANAIIS